MQISEIILNNYRAFYNEKGQETKKYKIDFQGKKNLLIYGENGSGKSSLFKGLKDLIISSNEPNLNFIRNIFSQDIELEEEPFVKVSFFDNGHRTQYVFSEDPANMDTDHEILRQVAKARSFMTYRDLLRVHFIEGAEVNLFDFLFSGAEALLGEMPNPSGTQPETRINMKDLWKTVTSSPDETNINDFCNGVNQIINDMSLSLNCLLSYFDKSLEICFESLTAEMIEKGTPSLTLKVKYFGKDIQQYHYFLNEARLSALAICIFLAAHLSIPKATYEILFLDDIFTGLDTSNRMPLLDILTADVIDGTQTDTFKDHQVVLTTYDRQWYELARNHLGSGDWSYQEIYIDKNTERKFDQPVLLPGEDSYERARHYFQMKHYPACANYQRKMCENLIKQFLPDHKKYDALPNGDIKPVDKLATLIDRFESYLTENLMDFSPFNKLKSCLRIVMNPLSHDDLESPAYRRELELVFDIIEELRKLENKIIIKAGQKIHMRKSHGKTGVIREYICELTTDVRKLQYGTIVQNTKMTILLLTQKDGTNKPVKKAYEGSLSEIYNKFCHSLEIKEEVNPLVDFQLPDGTNLNDFINQ